MSIEDPFYYDREDDKPSPDEYASDPVHIGDIPEGADTSDFRPGALTGEKFKPSPTRNTQSTQEVT